MTKIIAQLFSIQIWIMVTMMIMANLIQAQQTNIVLDQGAVAGIKVFPDSSRSAVYAFLGIPYARPPVDNLRFAAPLPHPGWNWTLQAASMKPICPQLTNTVYDETADGGTAARPAAMNEDCLYLNIWVPEIGMRFGNLPVLVIITGEEMSYDWPRNRPTGLDFASEGVVVVGVQYRSNIMGWLHWGTPELAGNYGLEDQELAMKWIRFNVQHFGGNPNQVTLLGHGTSGAPCVMAHVLRSFDSQREELFSKAVLMSGGDIEGSLAAGDQVLESSKVLVRKLGCHFDERGSQVVNCLRMKSVSDLQKAFESVYDHGNSSLRLGPVLPGPLLHILRNKTHTRSMPPMMVGITSNEAAFLHDYWLDLARDGYEAIRTYVNYTVLPSVLHSLAISVGTNQVLDALNWRYFSGEAAISVAHLLQAMQRLISEVKYETRFYRLLELLTPDNGTDISNVYAYIFETSNAMDMRGKVNLFGGASHSSDLPLLLGPSLFQQIARRRFTADEEKLCRKLRSTLYNFIKSGIPTPGRIYDAWMPYNKENKFIYGIGEPIERAASGGGGGGGGGKSFATSTAFDKNLPQIEKLLESDNKPRGGGGLSRSNRHDITNPYQPPSDGDRSINNVRRVKTASIANVNSQDSGYALHLKRIYGFWHVLLPNMAAYGGDGNYNSLNEALGNRIRYMEATADAARYRQGFYAMLGLVTLLLAVLGLCVYLLRRDPLRVSSSSVGRSSRLCL